jgi:hypothetical protein
MTINSNADRIRHANAMMQNDSQQRRNNKTITTKKFAIDNMNSVDSMMFMTSFYCQRPRGHIDAILQDEYGLVMGGASWFPLP